MVSTVLGREQLLNKGFCWLKTEFSSLKISHSMEGVNWKIHTTNKKQHQALHDWGAGLLSAILHCPPWVSYVHEVSHDHILNSSGGRDSALDMLDKHLGGLPKRTRDRPLNSRVLKIVWGFFAPTTGRARFGWTQLLIKDREALLGPLTQQTDRNPKVLQHHLSSCHWTHTHKAFPWGKQKQRFIQRGCRDAR